jgi:hypothetical protein
MARDGFGSNCSERDPAGTPPPQSTRGPDETPRCLRDETLRDASVANRRTCQSCSYSYSAPSGGSEIEGGGGSPRALICVSESLIFESATRQLISSSSSAVRVS